MSLPDLSFFKKIDSYLKRKNEKQKERYSSKIKKLESQLSVTNNPVEEKSQHIDEQNSLVNQKYLFNNDAAVKEFTVNWIIKDYNLKVEGNEYINFGINFFTNSPHSYRFKYKDVLFLDSKKDSLMGNGNPKITINFKIFKDGIRYESVEIDVGTPGYDGPTNLFYGSYEDVLNKIRNYYYLSEDTRRFILAVFERINYTKDIEFARRFTSSSNEFEDMLKHINYTGANKNNNPTLVIQNVKGNTEKITLEKIKRELIFESESASINEMSKKDDEISPLKEYIAKQKALKK